MRKAPMIFALLLLQGCAINRRIVTIPPAACSDLIPAEWAEGVQATPIPDNAAVPLGTPLTPLVAVALVSPWAAAYVGMSGQLEKANGRTADAMTIIRNCEKMVNQARPEKRR